MTTPIPSHLIDHVHLGDIMEVLRQLPDESIDMVYGDPDYNVGIKYNEKSYTREFDAYINFIFFVTNKAF